MVKEKVLTPSEFKRLSKSARAILVAKDVIKHLRLEIYNAKSGHYVNFKGKNFDTYSDQSARECLIDNRMRCEVCARGGLFLSMVRFKNKLSIRNANNASFTTYSSAVGDATKFMRDTFNMVAQELVEAAFEQSTKIACRLSLYEAKAAKAYGKSLGARVRDSKENLIVLMKNIISNKGVFIIPRKFFKADEQYKKTIERSTYGEQVRPLEPVEKQCW